MKIYIAGQITGNPDFQEHFAKVEAALTKKGHKVMNPAKLPPGFSQQDYMRVCFSMIDSCKAIVLLDNWIHSPGANVEKLYGEKIGHAIYHEQDVKELPQAI